MDRYGKRTTEEFIEKAKNIHGDKYDYSKVEYANCKTKVCIICHEKDEFGEEHGEFWITPDKHIQKCGCTKCTKNYIPTTEEWIKHAKRVHGDKYDYSKAEYKSNRDKVCIICHEKDEDGNEHGEFWQKPNNHIRLKQGCIKCAGVETLTTEQFIEKAKKVHGNKYDYSKVEYVNAKTKVCIICHKKDENGVEHGEFWQVPLSHLNGCGCPFCANEMLKVNQRHTTEQFIEKAKKVHGDRYDYSKVEYVNSKTKVCIICHEKDCKGNEHGEFWQTPLNHLSKKGCPICNLSKLENELTSFLTENNIKYEQQKHYSWLGKQSLDFYLPDYNLAIECQGIQHFIPVDFGGKGEEWAKDRLSYIKDLDKRKRKLCEENNVKILYYGDKNLTNELLDSKELLVEINKLNI